jgi:hypothetical protein
MDFPVELILWNFYFRSMRSVDAHRRPVDQELLDLLARQTAGESFPALP